MKSDSWRPWLALTGISVLAFISYMDFTVIATILPGIQRGLQASVGQLQWMINANTMMLAMFMVVAGRIGDIHGLRRLLYIGAGLFAVATALAGAAQSPEQLIACRFFQGFAGAIVNPVSAALIPHIIAERHRGLALGIYTSIVSCGLAIGPVVGGLLLTWASWRWAFYLNIPVILVGLAICWRSLDESPRQSGKRIDWPGLALLVITIGALLISLMEGEHWGWRSPATLGLFALAALAGAGFVWVERRAALPIIELSLFRHRLFVITCIAVTALGGFIGLGSFLPPLYLQNVLNEPPYQVGFMLLTVSLLVVLLPPLVGRLNDRFGHMPLLYAGLIALILAALAQAFLSANSPSWVILIGLALFGIGWGMLQTMTSVTAIAGLPVSASGVALGTVWTIWEVSSAACLALGGFVLETIDKTTLLASLAPFEVDFEPYQHRVISSLLSDPAEAHEILGQLSPGLEARIFPLFQESFTAGYNGAMWFLAAMVALSLLAILVINLRKPGADMGVLIHLPGPSGGHSPNW